MKITAYDIPAKLNKRYDILFLSDFHDRSFDDLKSLIEELKFDFIVITGDLVNTRIKDSKNGVAFLKYLLTLNKNIFYSLGNHEYQFLKEDTDYIKSLGITVLNNEFVHYGEFVIGGLTSCGVLDDAVINKSRNMKLDPSLDWLTDYLKEEGYKLLLNHHPEYYKRYLYKYDGIDLILSGHAHGGQIRFFDRGVYAPGQGLFPKYVRGLYDNKLLVSTGMKNTGIIVPRLFNEPEIVYISIGNSFE